jgi:hypothetical protein
MQKGCISFTQCDNILRMENRKKLAPAPHSLLAVTDFVSIQLASGGIQIVSGKEWLLAFGAKGLDFFGVEMVAAVAAL